VCDHTDAAPVKGLVETIAKHHGKLDILVTDLDGSQTCLNAKHFRQEG